MDKLAASRTRRLRAGAPLLAVLAACGPGRPGADPLADPGYSLYALVATVDGTSFGAPLGPAVDPSAERTGAFDPTLLARLSVVLEAEDAAAHVTTLGTFSAGTQPRLALLGPRELYFVNVPAATYFTDPALSYRFRVLLDGRELGRSDMSSKIFEVMRYVPAVPVGVKLRIEARAVPTIASLTPASQLVGSSDFPLTVTGSSFVHDSAVTFAGAALSTTWVSSTTLVARVPATLVLTAGVSNVAVVTPEPGGGTSAAAAFTTENPTPSLTSVLPDHVVAGSGDLTLTVDGGSFVPGAVVTLDGAPLQTTFVSASSLTASVPAALLRASGSFSIAASNPAPAAGPSAALSLVVQTPAPVVASYVPSTAVAGSGATTLTVNGTSFVAGAVVSLGGSSIPTTYVGATELRATVPAAALAAAGVLDLVVTNPAPTAGPSAARTFTVNNPTPALASLAPATATLGGGALTLTITGGSFATGAAASFDGTPLATTFVSSAQLTATLPASALLAAGTYGVTVANGAPSLGPSAPLTFTVNNPTPALSALTPASATAGGAAVALTIDGASFQSGAVASFNGANVATSFVSSTRLTATIPAAAIASAGTFTVSVANPAPAVAASGTLSFTVNNPTPSLTSMTPASATAGAAGFTLTVNGVSFVSGAAVTFNGASLVTTFVSSTRVTAAVPAASIATAGTYSVTAANPTPRTGVSAALSFVVNSPAPTLTSMTPASAAAGSGNLTVTLNGTNFTAATYGAFNGTSLTTTFVSATQLTATVPSTLLATAGSASVTVTTPSSGTSGALTFSITSAGVPDRFFVLGGSLGATSTDGVNWTTATWPTAAYPRNVVAGGNRYVAVAQNTASAFYSSNGTTWSSASFSVATPWDVTYGAGRFVAVGGAGQIAYSTDGATWTAATSPTTVTLWNVRYANGRFVAVGGNPYTAGVAVTSLDGVTWSLGSIPASRYFYKAAYGAGRWVAMGYFLPCNGPCVGTLFTSTDGITWSDATYPSAIGQPRGITFVGGRFIMPGFTGIATSLNGTTWSVTTWTQVSDGSVGYANSRWVVPVNNGNSRMSTDGTTWVSTSLTGSPSVASSATRFVTGYASGPLYQTSTDGLTWSTLTMPVANLAGFIFFASTAQ